MQMTRELSQKMSLIHLKASLETWSTTLVNSAFGQNTNKPKQRSQQI